MYTQTQSNGAAREEREQILIKLHLKITKTKASLKLYEVRWPELDLKPDNLSGPIRLKLGNNMAHCENSNCGNKISLLATLSSYMSLYKEITFSVKY